MDHTIKLSIYKGIIRYLLETTNYTLKNISELSGTLIGQLKAIYCENIIPADFITEAELVRLYLTALTLNPRKNRTSRYIVEINKINC